MRSATPPGQPYQSRRLDLHQHDAVYKTAAFLNRATSAFFQQECEESNPVGRLWRPLPLPGGHSCRPQPGSRGLRRNNYSRSVTFQYASLMNFDQLSIRMLWSA